MRDGKVAMARDGMNAGKLIAVVASSALLLFGGSPHTARSAPPQPPAPVPGTDTAIRAVLPDGTPAAGAVVTFGGKRYVANAQGTVRGPGIFARPRLVTGDFARLEGGFLGFFRKSTRYAAFLPVNTASGTPPEIRLQLVQVPDMDDVCRGCHPAKATADHPIERCVHKSGVPLKPALEVRVSQFNKENDDLRKAGKAAYPAIPLESRKVKKGLFGETRNFLVCTSCHTNHVDSGYKAYILMPFADKSILCLGCHV